MGISRILGRLGDRMVTAIDIVLEKGRGYMYKSRYPQVVVFSTSGAEIDKLIQAFGGHSYKHGTGRVWIVSRRAQLSALAEKMRPYQSRHGLESVLHKAVIPELNIDGITCLWE